MVRRAAGSAALVLAGEPIPLHPEEALFEAMIEGWRRQHSARRLSPSITRARERTVRRFAEFVEGWPWQWRSEQLDAWVAQGNWAHSTVRGYQGSVALFLDYVCDPHYGWAEQCMERFGEVPAQICHEWNTAAHVVEHESRPGRRPLTRDECQAIFDVADDMVCEIARSGRKGWLAAFRDATLFKVIYGWGLRRREAAMLDVGDFSVNPAAPELGRLGACSVRYGKAMRGSPPRRRQVASVMGWAVEALGEYLDDVRPRYGVPAAGPALWLTERGERISARRIDERFAAYRRSAGLPVGLSVHCLRHSYVSHLIEDGVDPLFVQHQVGHSWASTTAVYTNPQELHWTRAKVQVAC
ncbi:MAG: tyrosine-type recombinase/integrase [Actinomycetota bacterium]|jgi:site-specific recombinase XerD|nr:tyrosine-type recombinase/integrase [Actinomycetota bacterium]